MAKYRASRIFPSALPYVRSCGVRHKLMLASHRQPQDAFKKVSERGRGRLVPAKRPADAKTRGRGRPYVFTLLPTPVAQACSLLYRRVALCQTQANHGAWDGSDVLPITNRRYRLKICATVNRDGRPRPVFERTRRQPDPQALPSPTDLAGRQWTS